MAPFCDLNCCDYNFFCAWSLRLHKVTYPCEWSGTKMRLRREKWQLSESVLCMLQGNSAFCPVLWKPVPQSHSCAELVVKYFRNRFDVVMVEFCTVCDLPVVFITWKHSFPWFCDFRKISSRNCCCYSYETTLNRSNFWGVVSGAKVIYLEYDPRTFVLFLVVSNVGMENWIYVSTHSSCCFLVWRARRVVTSRASVCKNRTIPVMSVVKSCHHHCFLRLVFKRVVNVFAEAPSSNFVCRSLE